MMHAYQLNRTLLGTQKIKQELYFMEIYPHRFRPRITAAGRRNSWGTRGGPDVTCQIEINMAAARRCESGPKKQKRGKYLFGMAITQQ